MTKDIIEMARQAGIRIYNEHTGRSTEKTFIAPIDTLEAFAKLVAAKHDPKIAIADAYRAGVDSGIAAEREACAKLIEEMPCDCCWRENSIPVAEDFADAIRARGEA